MKNLIIVLLTFSSIISFGQSVGIGTETPHSSAALEIASTDQGILIPRTDTSSIATPAEGLLIFQNADQKFYYYNGSGWNSLGGSNILQDSDNDTKVLVESTPDNDQITFISKGVEVMSHNGQSLEMKNNGQSVFIGEFAGSQDDFSDNKNIFVGYKTGENNTTGTQNNAIGNQAMNTNTTGNNNISLGQQSLFKSNGSNNVALGLNAAKENTSGSKNMAIGNFSNFNNQTGTDNITIGDEAGRGTAAASKSGNVFVGSRSGKSSDTNGNVAIGRDALSNNQFGNNNIAIGDSAMQVSTGSNISGFGSDNVAIGGNAGKVISIGRKNTFVGNNAGQSNTSGSFNSAVGYGSGEAIGSGSHNTMVGMQSGRMITTGTSNVMLGSEAGDKSTTGASNVFVGRRAGFVNTEGDNNISIGNEAGLENRTGNNNIHLGHQAGRNVIGGSGNVFIGNEAGKDQVGSNQLIISNNENTQPLIEGRFDSLTTQINGQLSINNPDSTGYSLPTEDGDFGSLLRSDGDGNAYWFPALSITNTGGGSTPPTDDSSYDANNFEAVPCFTDEYYYDFDGIPGESNDPDYTDLIVGYGFDFSYNKPPGGGLCSNLLLSVRKAIDKATPKIFTTSFNNVVISDVVLYQVRIINGTKQTIMKFILSDVKITNVRHETYNRNNNKFSSYEVVNLSFEDIDIVHYTLNANGSQTETTGDFNCSGL